jgi:hypothetical protein
VSIRSKNDAKFENIEYRNENLLTAGFVGWLVGAFILKKFKQRISRSDEITAQPLTSPI